MGKVTLFHRGWNPKRLGIQKSTNGPHETEVWLYLEKGGRLEIVVQVNEGGVVKGQTVHRVKVPR